MTEAGDPVEKFAVALEQPGVISIAQTNGCFHERIEYQLEIESRTADHLEHPGGRRLQLPRFGELAPTCFELLLPIGARIVRLTRSRLRSTRTTLTPMPSA